MASTPCRVQLPISDPIENCMQTPYCHFISSNLQGIKISEKASLKSSPHMPTLDTSTPKLSLSIRSLLQSKYPAVSTLEIRRKDTSSATKAASQLNINSSKRRWRLKLGQIAKKSYLCCTSQDCIKMHLHRHNDSSRNGLR